jgi:predicted DNA-binding transcriptional regulator YafY
MRASRLLSILLLLQARGRMTAEALASEFEVSVRTIYRDVDQLSAADVPIYADRGPSGGFQLLDGYRTKLTGLSPAEAETLSLAGLPGPAAQLGLADVLTAAQLKLSAALPERARANAGRVAARFYLDPVGWFRSADDAKLLPTIANAVWNENCLDVRYRRAEGVVERRLQPLGLVLKAGVWYLVAQVGDQPRTYRVSNIIDLTVTEQSFKRLKNFDLARFWVTSSRAFETGVYHSNATLRVTARGLAKLGGLGSSVARAAAETATPADADGWLRVTIPIESIDRAASGLIALGADAEVVEPSELRERLATTVQELVRLYDAPTQLTKRRPRQRKRR